MSGTSETSGQIERLKKVWTVELLQDWLDTYIEQLTSAAVDNQQEQYTNPVVTKSFVGVPTRPLLKIRRAMLSAGTTDALYMPTSVISRQDAPEPSQHEERPLKILLVFSAALTSFNRVAKEIIQFFEKRHPMATVNLLVSSTKNQEFVDGKLRFSNLVHQISFNGELIHTMFAEYSAQELLLDQASKKRGAHDIILHIGLAQLSDDSWYYQAVDTGTPPPSVNPDQPISMLFDPISHQLGIVKR